MDEKFATQMVVQYVVFKLKEEEYALDIQKVMTIERMRPIARVPKSLEYIKGVINLRGEIIPIIDLNIKFGFSPSIITEDTRIIIIKIEDISLGIIVDEVDEVVQFEEESIENISEHNRDIMADYMFGIGKINSRIVTILDLEKLIKCD